MLECISAGSVLSAAMPPTVPLEPPAPVPVTARPAGPGTAGNGSFAVRGVFRRRPAVQEGIVLGILAFAVYLTIAPRDSVGLDYFIRLADAFLHGRLYLTEAPPYLTELIPRNGVWYVAYPPVPAVLLMPFVAAFGTGFPEQVLSCLCGGIAVGLVPLVLEPFALTRPRRVFLAAVFGFGTVLFYVSEAGLPWYLSHAVAVMFSMAALALVLRRRAPVLAGLFLGLATASRLPVGLSAPFYAATLFGFAGGPAPATRRRGLLDVVAFAIGLAIPVGLNALYDFVRFGSPLPVGYALIPGVLQEPYYTSGLLSIDYLPRQLYAIFLRTWNFVEQFPWLKPSWWGLGVFFTTPLFLWLVKARPRDPRVAWAIAGTVLALVPDVTHGNVGFTQFGYRFSLDVQPLLLILLATVFERGLSRVAVAAGAASIAFTTYGVVVISRGFVSY